MVTAKKYSGIPDYCKFHFGSLRWARKADADTLARGIDDAWEKGDTDNAHRLNKLFLRKASPQQAGLARRFGLRELNEGHPKDALPLMQLARDHHALSSSDDYRGLGYALLRNEDVAKATGALREGATRCPNLASCNDLGNAAVVGAMTQQDANAFSSHIESAKQWYNHALQLSSPHGGAPIISQNLRVASALGHGVAYGVAAGLDKLAPFSPGAPTPIKSAVLAALDAGAVYSTSQIIMIPTMIGSTLAMMPQTILQWHRLPANDAAMAQISRL